MNNRLGTAGAEPQKHVLQFFRVFGGGVQQLDDQVQPLKSRQQVALEHLRHPRSGYFQTVDQFAAGHAAVAQDPAQQTRKLLFQSQFSHTAFSIPSAMTSHPTHRII